MRGWPSATLALGATIGLGLFRIGCDGARTVARAGPDLGRDSAGVWIVENGAAVGWSSENPPVIRVDLEIGTPDGGGPDTFGHVVAVDVDAAGNVYVLDQQAGHVVVFDADGRHRRTLGNPGSGPGELGAGTSTVVVGPGGHVTVPDVGNARVTTFAPDGSATSWSLTLQQGVPIRWDGLADGTLAAQLRAIVDPASGLSSDPIVRYGTNGVVLDTIISLPEGASVTVGADGLPTIRLFEPEPLWDVASDGTLVWAMNSAYEIRAHAPGGSLTTVVRRQASRRPVSREDQRALTGLVQDMLADQGVPPAALQAISDRLRIAEHFPALAAIHLDSDGGIWVQRVGIPSEADDDTPLDPMNPGSPEWDVFDANGRWLGTVRLPDRFTMMAIRGDALYGVVRDGLDVQRVVRLRLEN